MVVVVIATVPVLMFPQINPELVADTMKTWKIDELMDILPPVIWSKRAEAEVVATIVPDTVNLDIVIVLDVLVTIKA